MAIRPVCVLLWLFCLIHIGFAAINDHILDSDIGYANASDQSLHGQGHSMALEGSTHFAHIEERWISLPELPTPPAVPHAPYPWPKIRPGCSDHWIRYCFLDDRSAFNLGEILRLAIARWGPAMDATSLRISPDPACGTLYFCICDYVNPDGVRVSTDSLQIWDGMVDDEWQHQQHDTHSSLGYKYNSQDAWRHRMKFGTYHPLNPMYHNIERASLAMAHELGHVAGLFHEHQRSNAPNFININWQNMWDYDAAVAAVNAVTDQTIFPTGMSAADRIAKVVTNYQLATTYFPAATAWMSVNSFDSVSKSHLIEDGADYFDVASIMIYTSTDGGDRPVIELIHPEDDGNTFVFCGGNPDPNLAGLSYSDIERLSQLYPLDGAASGSGLKNKKLKRGPNDSTATNNTKPAYRPVQVFIAGEPNMPKPVNVTIRPPPPWTATDAAKFMKFPSTNESDPFVDLVGIGHAGKNDSQNDGKDGVNTDAKGSGDASSSATGAESTST